METAALVTRGADDGVVASEGAVTTHDTPGSQEPMDENPVSSSKTVESREPMNEDPVSSTNISVSREPMKEDPVSSTSTAQDSRDVSDSFSQPLLESSDQQIAVSSTSNVEKESSGEIPVSTQDTPIVFKAPVSIIIKPISKRVTGIASEKQEPQQIPIAYEEPSWGGQCSENYSFEIIKNGVVVDNLDLKTKSFFVFGRLPSCDITMEHPSLSRYHAVVQYSAIQSERRDIGWYLYDLDSTHGTWVNKRKVKPRVYIRLRVGFVVKFGGSSRLNILQGPDEDQEAEAELSITEMKEQREKQQREAEVLRQADLSDKLMPASTESEGCSWGMDDDDMEIDKENPFALDPTPQNEELYLDDPKKTLRGFYEREGHDLPEYDVAEEGHGQYKCRVELPVYGASGESLIAEVTVSGKKKDAVAACALEACRLLDRHGELRKSTHESRAVKKKNWEENDYYDSDEDTFLDRTGDIEKKRKMRMQKVAQKQDKAENYDSLVAKLSEIDKEISDIESKLEKGKDQAKTFEEEGLDVFDAYMMSLKSGALDTKTRTNLKRQIFELKQQKTRLERLANIAKPALPSFQKATALSKSGMGPLFGKMKGPAKGSIKMHITKPVPVTSSITTQSGEFVEEEEEEEEEAGILSRNISTADSPSDRLQPSAEDRGPDSCLSKKEITSVINDKADLEKSKETSKKVLGPSWHPSSARKTDLVTSEETKISSTESDINSCKGISDAKKTDSADSASSIRQEHNDHIHQMAPPERSIEKKRSKRDKHKDSKKPRKIATDNPDYADRATDPDYDVWVPPSEQSGDGKTHLNAKFGY